MSPLLLGIPLEENREVGHRFLLFQGARQMPPVPASHADIEQLGDGRYSVWNRQCIFSSSSSAVPGHPYWIVENTPETAPLLEYVPQFVPRVPPAKDLSVRLESFFAASNRTREPVELHVGDRVALVTGSLGAGGAERQWCYLATGLKRRGFDVTMIVTGDTAGPSGHFLPLLESEQVPVLALEASDWTAIVSQSTGSPSDAALLRLHSPFGGKLYTLSRLLRTLSPKAVFAQLDAANLLTAIAAEWAGIPRVILSFRSYNPTNFPRICEDWYQTVYRAASRSPRVLFTGNTRLGGADYAKWIGIPESQVAWIPNVVDPAHYPMPSAEAVAALRSRLGITASTPVIVGVLRYTEEKRPELFLQICAAVAKVIPAVRVFVAGAGPLQEEAERYVASAGIAKQVTILGRVEDPAPLIACGSLLLLTSRLEGMPNVVLEAQLLGVPVVATNVGGVPDCVEHGKTGLLVERDDVEGFVGACIELLRAPTRARAMGDAAAARMNGRFPLDAIVDRYLHLAQSAETHERPTAS